MEIGRIIIEGLDKALIKLVDFVLEGKMSCGELAPIVIDCSVDPWRTIRQESMVVPDL